MDSAAKKAATTTTTAQPAAEPPVHAAPPVALSSPNRIQTATRVSSPDDAEEKEAESTAQQVMRMAIPDHGIAYVRSPRGGMFRQVETGEGAERKEPPVLRSPYLARFAHLGALNRAEELGERKTEELQRQSANEERPEPVQRQAAEEPKEEAVQRQAAEEPKEEAVQRRATEEPKEEAVQRQAAEEPKDEPVQRQAAEEPKEEAVQRQAAEEPKEEAVQRQARAEEQPEKAVQRSPAKEQREDKLQRQIDGMPDQAANVSAEIRSARSGGNPLPLSVRRYMEPRFQASFGNVRVHTDDNAARLNRQVSAKAFTVDNHIFFGRGQFQPETDQGRELIAHELTHTIQQGAAVQRKAAPRVTRGSGGRIHRLGISDALDYIADKAYNIPGFRMFTIILGVNPINMSRVDRSAGNILRAIIEFLPGGALITQALDNHGVFNKVSAWVKEQFESLAMTGAMFRDALYRFLDSLSWRDIFRLGSVWRRAKRIFTEPIGRLISFGRSLVRGIINLIKDAILRPLARLVARTRGYDLLTAVLGFDPITGDSVPRTAATLIGGFMRLIGQEEIWNNIQRAKAIPRAWAWFQGTLSGLLGFVRQIPTLFINAFRSLTIGDIVVLPRALGKVIGVFAGIAGQFFSWAGGQVLQLLQIIFEVVAPGAMPFIRRAGAAFRTIIQNPVGFVRNLVRAGQMGLRAFARNFLTHLKASLIGWLTGAMSGAGVYIPQAFTVKEILKFILSVLGLTWQNIRAKLVRAVGEPTVVVMEKGFELIQILITEGPAAAWEKIVEHVQNLKDLVIEQVMAFVQSRIVQAAITKLVSMLSPAGAFIQAIIATYNTIMFFVERLRQIMQVAMAFVNSIAAIAAGRIQQAAARVEQTMAGLLTLVISFLARLAGLGKVSDAVTNVINRVRQPIDRALDRIVEWIVAQARRLGRFVAQAGVPQDPQERVELAAEAAVAAAQRLTGKVTESLLRPALGAIKVRYGLTLLEPFQQDGVWWVRAAINPDKKKSMGIPVNGEAGDDPDADRGKARAAFGQRLFSRAELQGELQISASTANRRVQDWMGQGSLHRLASSANDPLTLYSFDPDKAGQRETNPNNRSKYGYSNPAKESSVGLQVLSIGLLTDRSPKPIKRTDAEYHRSKAWYKSVLTATVFKWARAILGHRPPGASGHWNRIGHLQARSDNMAWNRSLPAYHGPEEAGESAATGGASERYRVPSKEAGSHPSWW